MISGIELDGVSDWVEERISKVNEFIYGWLVVVEKEADDWAEIFVELKGVDVASAIDQLKASLENPIFSM